MKTVKRFWITGVFLIAGYFTQAQVVYDISQSAYNHYGSEIEYLKRNPGSTFMGLHADPQFSYRYPSPWLTNWTTYGGQSYWLNSTTTQSFNRGKFGTIYYYDQMGNMRNASTFIDIAGKNKRGLKLLLPTFNQRTFMGR